MPEFKEVRDTLVTSITSLWRKAEPSYPVKDPKTTEQPTITDEESRWAETAKIFDLRGGRKKKYDDFKEMDSEIVELSSALDLYADFVVSGSKDTDETYNFDCANPSTKVVDRIHQLETTLRLKEKIWFISRDLCKFGDVFTELVATESQIVKTQNLPVTTMWYNFVKKTGEIDPNWPYVQRQYEGGEDIVKFAPWEITHFKMGDELYGVDNGILSKLRRTYRVMRMLEDGMLINRLTRAQRQLIYNIDVSNMGVMEAMNYLRRLKRLNRRRRFISSAGKVKTEFNPLAPVDDIYNPVRRGGVSDIKVIHSDSSVAAIADIEHFHNKLFTGTKVPKAYLGFERDVNAKATLVQQSLAFVKVVRRVRQAMSYGLRKIYRLDMILGGIDPNSFDWKLRFPGFGVADEELHWKMEMYKATIIRNYVEAGLDIPMEWVVRHFMLGLSQSEANEFMALAKKGPILVPAKAQQGAPSKPTGKMPSGGKTGSPTGTEAAKISAIAEKVGKDGKIQEMLSELRYILKTGRTKDEFY